MSAVSIENLSRREKFHFIHTIGVRYETSPEKMRKLLADIRRLLAEHPKIEPDTCRVRFIRFGPSSLDIELFAYVLAPEYPVFLETQEELLLRLMKIVEAAGTGFAFPSTTTYLASDHGI